MRPKIGNAKYMLSRLHRPLAVLLLALAPILSSCGIINFGAPTSIVITATPTGCGTKIDNFKTISWWVTFSATGGDPGATYQWSFSDGVSAAGQTVVKFFDTATQESGTAGNPFTDTGEHDPVKFDVTVVAGSQSATKTYELPMRGTPDGGPDPSGDTCIPDEGRTHVATGTILCYAANPPASGPHFAAQNVSPVAPGFYDEALATERWVHNLEHGTVVLLYDCGGTCSNEIKADLQALFDSLPPSPRFNEKKMVITRYAGIGASCSGTATFPGSGPFLAIAWDVQRAFDSLDTQGITDFYLRHVDHGPEDEPIPQ